MKSKAEKQVEKLLAVARSQKHVREKPRGSNRSVEIDEYNEFAGAKLGSPWCASYVSWCLSFIPDDPKATALPVKRTASCQQMYDACPVSRRIPPGEARSGDVFLIWFPSLGRYAHTGFITAPPVNGKVATIEGNTNDGGSRDGWGVYERTRTLGPKDVVLRWT